ncbi:MAG: four helix bundle protein [Nitrospirota bacterium]|nr:four helix bundle protein [Nitrospirota bacterium]
MCSKKMERFDDLIAWQKARELTKQIYTVTGKKPFPADFGLREQIQRATVSIMSNLAEGFERGISSEFHQFIVIAKASCAEVRSKLYTALDIGYITKEEFNVVNNLSAEVSRIICGLKVSVNKQRTKK